MNLEEIKALAKENEQKYEQIKESLPHSKRRARIKQLKNKILKQQQQIEKLEKLQSKSSETYYEDLDKIEKEYPHGNKGILSKIAEEIMSRHEELNAFEILGAFGMNCEFSIWFFENEADSKSSNRVDNIKASLMFFGTSEVWTGEMSNKYAQGTIGELNGGNYVMAKVESIEQLDELVIKSMNERETLK